METMVSAWAAERREISCRVKPLAWRMDGVVAVVEDFVELIEKPMAVVSGLNGFTEEGG